MSHESLFPGQKLQPNLPFSLNFTFAPRKGGPRKPFEETTRESEGPKFSHDFLDDAFEESDYPDGNEGGPDPEWKTEDKCNFCSQTYKVGQIRCSSCGCVLRGPELVQPFQSARMDWVSFFILFLAVQLCAPFAWILFNSPFRENQVNLSKVFTKWLDYLAGDEITDVWLGVLILVAILWVLAALFLSNWVTKAHKNLKALHAQGYFFPHRISGVIFLAPLIFPASLFAFLDSESGLKLVGPLAMLLICIAAPYLVMREIWKGSSPRHIDATGLKWRESNGSFFLFIWWISGLLFPLSFFVPFAVNLANGSEMDLKEIWIVTPAQLQVSMGLIALSTILTLILLARINYRQRKRLENIVHAWEHANRSRNKP